MTRFTRAKGSKSSNEKLPEEGTPWSEMKRSVLMNQQKQTQRTSTAYTKNSTKEVKPPEWYSLDDENDVCLGLLKSHLKKNVIEKIKEKLVNSVEKKNKINEESSEVSGDLSSREKKKITKRMIRKEMKRLKQREQKTHRDKDRNEKRKVKIMMKKLPFISGGNDSLKVKSEKTKVCSAKDKIQKECTSVKLENRKRKNEELIDNSAAENSAVAEKVKFGKRESQDEVEGEKDEAVTLNTTSKMKGVKKSKKEGTFVRGRKKPKNFAKKHDQSGRTEKKLKNQGNKFITQVNIGGEMVTLIKYQGYYVTKDDAKRLKEMKRKMTEEGIPKSEVESVIKLERRKCEKSLARMKKNVCFQCRKPGHILSQCPELQNNIETGTGICYKCGSTEHKAFTCKVMHKQKYPFAECFICKEKGHIARECPDNPRGLYPNGGCCKLCGDVTHLKKDCPTKILESEEKTLKAGMRDDRNVEGLEDVIEKQETNARKKRVKLVTY